MAFLSHLKSFISFRFSVLLGLAMSIWLFNSQSETKPLVDLLTGIQIYLIAFLIVFGVRLCLWVIIEKAGMYSIKNTLLNIVVDYITCVAAMLCGSGCLFLLNTFLS